jgi:hypothetical protein
LRTGHPPDDGTTLGPVISEVEAQRVEDDPRRRDGGATSSPAAIATEPWVTDDRR